MDGIEYPDVTRRFAPVVGLAGGGGAAEGGGRRAGNGNECGDGVRC